MRTERAFNNRRWARLLGPVVRRCCLAALAAAGMIVGLLLHPDPAFAYSRHHVMFDVMSDRPIDPAMDRVLDDAAARLRTSSMHRYDDRFRLFICNQPWRFALFSRTPSAGGVTDMMATRNIYLREVDAKSDRIVIPASWGALADAEDRTLAYFVAHEGAHVMQSRRLGRLVALSTPRWLREGYADFVAKAGRFDLAANRDLLRKQDYLLSEEYARTGLYRRYHLMVAAQLRTPGTTVADLFAAPPSEADAVRAALAVPD